MFVRCAPRQENVDPSPCFVLKPPNGEVIGTSEMYSTEAARDLGVLKPGRVALHVLSMSDVGFEMRLPRSCVS